jgi:mycothiol synthase
MLAGERAPIPLAGVFFVTLEDHPVGTMCMFLHPGENGDIPEPGWVAVHPIHRGHGLGQQLWGATLGFIRDSDHNYAYLLTEDFRLPAIKMYLRLGFEPEMADPSHPERWEALRKILK